MDPTQVTQVAKGITDYGALAVISAFYLLLSASMMIALFKWFKTIINQLIESSNSNLKEVLSETRKQNDLLNDLAEGLRPETQLRLRNLTGLAFDLSIEQVCRLIKKTREENHIADKEATHDKIVKSLKVIHDDRNNRFDTFTYKGVPLSSYCLDEWVTQVAQVVESEIYHEDGPNNKRAFTNIKLVYDNIKTNLYHRLK